MVLLSWRAANQQNPEFAKAKTQMRWESALLINIPGPFLPAGRDQTALSADWDQSRADPVQADCRDCRDKER